jgi:predicted RNA-binding protein (virulence factor B family)
MSAHVNKYAKMRFREENHVRYFVDVGLLRGLLVPDVWLPIFWQMLIAFPLRH